MSSEPRLTTGGGSPAHKYKFQAQLKIFIVLRKIPRRLPEAIFVGHLTGEEGIMIFSLESSPVGKISLLYELLSDSLSFIIFNASRIFFFVVKFKNKMLIVHKKMTPSPLRSPA